MEENNQNAQQQKSYGYGKKPLWWWIVLYVVIGAIVYGAVYYFFFYNKGGYNYSAQHQNQSSTTNSNNYMIQNMKVEILKAGSGPQAKPGDKVIVNYTGTLQDGTKFDSSLNPGRTPFPFTIGDNNIIPGWNLGVAGMKVGEKRRLTIPPELGYGTAGSPPIIPPNATLIFEIDLLKIN
jgi:FKBP-type peptidyl-prolyl cis-trans isomerase